jgi:tetratricopeptide (TPR) repeat protein
MRSFLICFPLACLCLALTAGVAFAADPVATYTEMMERATQYEQGGDIDKAIEEMTRLTRLLPDNADGYYWLARLQRERGDFAKAILNYQRGIMLDPNRHGQALWNIAYSHVKWSENLEKQGNVAAALQHLSQAIGILERLQKDPGAAVLQDVDWKKTYQTTREHRDALAQQLHADDLAVARDARGRAGAWFDRGLVEPARRELLNAIDLDPDNAPAWKELGKCYAAGKDFAKAAEACQKAIALDPRFKEAYNNLGVNQDELQRYDKAIAAFSKALELDPGYLLALNNMGLTYQRMGEHGKAIESYQRALKIDPDNVTAHFNLAGIRVLMKEYDAALDHCRRLLRADPFNLNACSLMGDICMIVGRADEAAAAYQKALLIAPDDAQTREALGRAIQKRDTALLQRYFDHPALSHPAAAAVPTSATQPAEPTATPATAAAEAEPTSPTATPLSPDAAPVSAPIRTWGAARDDRASSLPMVRH